MNNSSSKILLLVEGEDLEKNVFEELSRVYRFKSEIYCLKCNLFMLYEIMKEYEFNASIKDILFERNIGMSDEEKKVLQDNKFAYTYLVMDFDLQHNKNNVEKELKQAKEMCEYFVDETDDTIGKLYINYPMMESFRDRDGIEDIGYCEKIVNVNQFTQYKELAGKSRLSSKHLNEYKRQGLDIIIKSNIEKVYNKLFDSKVSNYQNYIKDTAAINIFNNQLKFIKSNFVYIINTSLFIIVDYFGESIFNMIFIKN